MDTTVEESTKVPEQAQSVVAPTAGDFAAQAICSDFDVDIPDGGDIADGGDIPEKQHSINRYTPEQIAGKPCRICSEKSHVKRNCPDHFTVHYMHLNGGIIAVS